MEIRQPKPLFTQNTSYSITLPQGSNQLLHKSLSDQVLFSAKSPKEKKVVDEEEKEELGLIAEVLRVLAWGQDPALNNPALPENVKRRGKGRGKSNKLTEDD